MNRTNSASRILSVDRAPLDFLFALGIVLAVAPPAGAVTDRNEPSRLSQTDRLNDLLLAEKQSGTYRESLIDAVLAQSPDDSAARGLGGYVRYLGQWIPAEAAAQYLQKSENLRQYHERRNRYPNSPVGQRGLAAWCEAHHLPDQRRAHLTRVLQLAPDDADARAKLGYVRINGMWVVQDELRRASQAMDLWLPRLQALHYQLLESRQPGALPDPAYEQALATWKKIDDPAVIPAMERVFSMNNDVRGASMVIAKLCGMDGSEATISLARHALSIADDRVRELVIAELKKRPLEHYVPALLECLYTPSSVQAALISMPDGRLLLRQVFSREGVDRKESTMVDSLYRVHSVDPFTPNSSRQQVVAAARSQIELENGVRSETNRRICSLLAATTGVHRPAVPESWWQWWNDYNEVYVEGEKQVATAYYCRELTVVSPPTPIAPTHTASHGDDDGHKDCLVAGTKIWTEHGPTAIEKLRCGDLLLSQDARTGELAFKPVLKTTTRRPGVLVQVETSGTRLQCSGGHRFWVAGKGWVKARSLATADPLHGATGAHLISVAGPGPRSATFNVVVADFHTYFVGPEKLLSHDNTMADPAQGPLPGLKSR